MSIETTRNIIKQYFDSVHTDFSMMAEDVVFTNMATGDNYNGINEVSQMLIYVYKIAFDARAETQNIIITETNAVLEGEFVGRHIGEFAGIPPMNKIVRVPLCVVYDIEGAKIKRARIYFEMPALMAQLNQK
ncbi:MAG: ester cyclase [Ignavibacterium sp.]